MYFTLDMIVLHLSISVCSLSTVCGILPRRSAKLADLDKLFINCSLMV